MKNLAPDIIRKRFLIEGYYEIEVDEQKIKEFFSHLCKKLNLRMYGKPIIFSPSGMGKGENQGYDAFVPLIDSGISLYVWSSKKFLSCVIYTCKDFEEKAALKETKQFFRMAKIASAAF
ncbi:MAG: S-adenosylmethionine decarboxylase [Chlamydiae bacterium]|nr:S-adenosylmethionine decarboxylase [Chlamydiota bacterium]